MFSFFGGGHGAHPEGDGLNHGNAPISTATIPPLEILEAAYPVRFTSMGVAARIRAARGTIAAALARSTRSSCWRKRRIVFLFGERGRYPPPPGVAGGGPGAVNRFAYQQDDGEHSAADGLEDGRHPPEARPKGAAGNPGRRRLRPARWTAPKRAIDRDVAPWVTSAR